VDGPQRVQGDAHPPLIAPPVAGDEVAGEVGVTIRPRFRGVIHRWATPFAALLFAVLIARAGSDDRAAVVVYGVCVTAMLAVSAAYHSGRTSPVATRVLKRVDHATILFAIAGTYTAVTVLALDGAAQARMLAIVWAAAGIGIAVRMVWLDAPYPVVAAVYLVVGWLMVVDLPGYLRGMPDGPTALVVTGGLLYTAGGAVYAVHRPNPWPAAFGYHEVFHALVVAGAAAHYLAITGLL
jgi:hemolysin III